MDYATNKAIMIAVGIFITLTIASAIFVTINQVKGIYGYIYKTDVSLKNKFGEFDMYNGVTMTGLDMLNTVKKYANNSLVEITYFGGNIQTDGQRDSNNVISNITKITNVSNYTYYTKYHVEYKKENDKNVINFTNI